MNNISPRFGLVNGLATTSSFLIPSILLGTVLIFDWHSMARAPVLIWLAIGTRFLGDWLFWTRMFPTEMKPHENWGSHVKEILLSQPVTIKAKTDLLMDVVTDASLIYMSLRASVPPLWVFLGFFTCYAISAPIHGIIADSSSKMKFRKFSMIVTAIAFMTSLGISGVSILEFYAQVFGLNAFSASIQMLIILCAKWLFAGTSTIGKSTIAEVLKAEIAEKESEREAKI